jgi:hypothetical protein
MKLKDARVLRGVYRSEELRRGVEFPRLRCSCLTSAVRTSGNALGPFRHCPPIHVPSHNPPSHHSSRRSDHIHIPTYAMLDTFEILTTSGVVLWSRTYVPVGANVINSLIRDVFIEERILPQPEDAGSKPTYKKEGYTLKWTASKDVGLIFVVCTFNVIMIRHFERHERIETHMRHIRTTTNFLTGSVPKSCPPDMDRQAPR